MQSRVRALRLMNRSEGAENFRCLEWYESTDRDVPVTNLLESRHGRCIGPWAPALSHPKRLQPQLRRSAARPEFRDQFEGNALTFPKIRRNLLGWQRIKARLKIEDDMID